MVMATAASQPMKRLEEERDGKWECSGGSGERRKLRAATNISFYLFLFLLASFEKRTKTKTKSKTKTKQNKTKELDT